MTGIFLPDGIFSLLPFIFACERSLSPEPIELIYGIFLLINGLWTCPKGQGRETQALHEYFACIKG